MIKISAQLSSFLDRCDEQQKKAIVSYFDELIDEFNNKRDLMGERGSVIHFMKKMEECVEKFINHSNNKELIQCGKGCSHCCYYQVEISYEEGLVILDEIQSKNINVDWNRLKYISDIDKENWYELPLELRRCPLLNEEGECLIYKKRPLACRKHNVVSFPDFCQDRPNDLVSGISNPVIESISSAVMSVSKKSDLLAKQILNIKENGNF